MANATVNTFATVSISNRIRAAYEDFKAARVLRAKYVETVRELEQLDDRELTDLGISRYDIPSIAQEHVYGA